MQSALHELVDDVVATRRKADAGASSWIAAGRDDLAALARYRFVIQHLVATQLTLRYHRSVLGIGWTLLNPLLLLSVQAMAFSQILQLEAKSYTLYLFSGLILWQFFLNAIESGSRSLIANERLIRAVSAPKFIFPLSECLVALIHAGFTLGAFFVVALVLGAPFHVQLVLLPAGVFLLGIFTFGLVLVAMTLMTFFRDFAHIIGVLLSACYFASPILYPPEFGNRFQIVLRYNPLSYYLEFFHDALVSASFLTQNPAAAGGVWPSADTWLVASACSAVSLLSGYLVYKTFEHDYIFHL
jgi:ABC-type polysaccharide/polyol phosphate export permease